MKFSEKIKNFFTKYFFNAKWRCNICGKEIFEEGYFCKECYEKLPFNNGKICNHCGRAVIGAEEYCSTCKNVLVSTDCSRSVFNYEGEVRKIITKAKYNGKKYLLEVFSAEMANIYFRNYFNADFLCFVPMTEKALKKRGYNQAEFLAKELSKRINVPVKDCLIKKRDTEHQAKLSRRERLKNLENVFKVTSRKEIKDKRIVIVDDVTTTGATAEAVASTLKRAGAKLVYLITLASVPPIEGY